MVTKLTFDAALFDMDGTLVDSNELVALEWKQWAQTKNIDVERILDFSHGKRTGDVIRHFLPDINVEQELISFFQMAYELDQSSVSAIGGALEIVRSIPQDRWAVVTSAPSKLAKQRLTICGFPMPPVLIAAENVRRGKPDPEGFLSACTLLKQDPKKCLAFEDSPAGVEAAMHAGIRTIALRTTHREHNFKTQYAIDDYRSAAVAAKNGSFEFIVK